MPPKKRPASHDASRLKVLAAGDEQPFLACVSELLASGDRLAREAALEALIERPLAEARSALRTLYFELDADGLKRDQGARMRTAIVRILLALRDVRDADVGARASETSELLMGDDVTYELRSLGLRLLADIAPATFPFYAVEHLDDRAAWADEPANTAFQLLAATGHHAAIYQWLISGDRDAPMITVAFELLADAPRAAIERYVARAVDVALRKQDDALCIVLAEAIVRMEIAPSYDALARMMSAKISDELYGYLGVLLAGTNRPALLAILEHELHRGRRPQAIVDALRIRTTPEQAAILKRWEEPPD